MEAYVTCSPLCVAMGVHLLFVTSFHSQARVAKGVKMVSGFFFLSGERIHHKFTDTACSTSAWPAVPEFIRRLNEEVLIPAFQRVCYGLTSECGVVEDLGALPLATPVFLLCTAQDKNPDLIPPSSLEIFQESAAPLAAPAGGKDPYPSAEDIAAATRQGRLGQKMEEPYSIQESCLLSPHVMAAAAGIARDSVPLLQAIEVIRQRQKQRTTSPADLTATVMALVPAATVDMLAELGFSRVAIQRALLENHLDETAALNYLLSCDSEVAGRPFTEGDIARYAATFLKQGGAADPQLSQLVDMGFSSRQARVALLGAEGDFGLACAALLGEPMARSRIQQNAPRVECLISIEEDIESGVISADDATELITQIAADAQSVVHLWQTSKFRKVLEVFAADFQKHCGTGEGVTPPVMHPVTSQTPP